MGASSSDLVNQPMGANLETFTVGSYYTEGEPSPKLALITICTEVNKTHVTLHRVPLVINELGESNQRSDYVLEINYAKSVFKSYKPTAAMLISLKVNRVAGTLCETYIIDKKEWCHASILGIIWPRILISYICNHGHVNYKEAYLSVSTDQLAPTGTHLHTPIPPSLVSWTKNTLQHLAHKTIQADVSCSVCKQRKIAIVFTCGHTSCDACAPTTTTCNRCKTPVTQRNPLYLP